MQLRFFLRWQEKAVAKKAFLNLRRQNGSLRRQKNADAFLIGNLRQQNSNLPR